MLVLTFDFWNYFQPFGYAIRSFGPLTIENTCFIDNIFENFGPVLVLGAPYNASQNYVSSNQTGLNCSFIALFETQQAFKNGNPTCVNVDLNMCRFTQAPTQAPSGLPMQPTLASGQGTSPPNSQSSSSSRFTLSSLYAIFLTVTMAKFLIWGVFERCILNCWGLL